MSNRAKGEGCYWHNDKLNRWVFRIQLKDIDGNPKIYTLSSKNRPELKVRVAKFMANYEATKQPMREYMKLEEYSQYWLESIKPTISSATWDYYSRLTRLYIVPEFGNTKITDLTPLRIQTFFNALTNRQQKINKQKTLSRNTANGIRRTFIALLNSAIDNKIISSNPAAKTKPQRIIPKEIIALDEIQLNKMLKIASNNDYIYVDVKRSKEAGEIKYYTEQQRFIEDEGMIYNRHCFLMEITLAAFTGMRLGEVLGLTWDNVNFSTSEIFVKNSLSKLKTIKEPKTFRSIRKILLDKSTTQQLKKFKEEQDLFQQKFHGNFVNKHNLIFTNMFGGFVNIRNQKDSYWDKLLIAADLPKGFTFHSLRHTHATLLLKSGVDVRTVSERLGHASAVMTLNVYAHSLKTMQESAINAINMWRT